jgi:hypothetical protein
MKEGGKEVKEVKEGRTPRKEGKKEGEEGRRGRKEVNDGRKSKSRKEPDVHVGLVHGHGRHASNHVFTMSFSGSTRHRAKIVSGARNDSSFSSPGVSRHPSKASIASL